MPIMKNLTLFIISILFSITVFAQGESHNESNKFDPGRNPDTDLKTAVTLAKNENKRIILDVGGEWCIWCHRIDAFMHNTDEVKVLIDKNYIVVKVNFSKENKNEEFLSKYPPIEGYPHFFVLDKNGKLIHSQNTGDLEKDKDYDKEKFISFLEKWKPVKK